MGDWTTYIHDRLSRLERQVFGDEEAAAIAATAPVYDATTEASTRAGAGLVQATGTGPNQPPQWVANPEQGTASPGPVGPPVGPAPQQQAAGGPGTPGWTE